MALTVSTTQPNGGTLGDEWYNPSTNEFKKLIATNGTIVNWTTIGIAFPTQGGNVGKALLTDGQTTYWGTVSTSGGATTTTADVVSPFLLVGM
jgi:hypothetical protein